MPYLTLLQKVGSEIVLDDQRDKTMVQSLLDMRARLDLFLEGPFRRDPAFAHAIKVHDTV